MENSPGELLELVVRFTASIGDISLTIESPQTTSGLSLKQLIRKQLPASYTSKRLRLIYAGKVLPDADALSSSLNLDFHRRNNYQSQNRTNTKGKQPVRDSTLNPPLKLYIHCSIGDSLSEKELREEVTAANAAEQALQSPTSEAAAAPDTGTAARNAGNGASPAPRGFDRLLSTGFTATEVAALRAQFLTILSHTHTPDTMPSGTALSAMEDRWLDSDANTAGGASGSGDVDGETWGPDDGRALDDFLWGNVIVINLVFGFAKLTG
jgi:hypothetical protein